MNIKIEKKRRDLEANEHMITLLNEKVKLSIDEFTILLSNKDKEIEDHKNQNIEQEKVLLARKLEIRQLKKKIKRTSISNLDDEDFLDDDNKNHVVINSPETKEVLKETFVNIQKNDDKFGIWFKKDLPTKYELRESKLNGSLFCSSSNTVWAQKKWYLRGAILYFFDREDSREGANGDINLEGCNISKSIDEKLFMHNFQFIIDHPTLKSLYFSTKTEKMLNDWFNGISAAIESTKVSTKPPVNALKNMHEIFIDTR